MTQAQWIVFIASILNERDRLIAQTALQGGKCINEVLTLNRKQNEGVKNEITFVQSKTKGKQKETVITYPNHLMVALKKYG